MTNFGDLQAFYTTYDEACRLESGPFQLERERTRELLERHIPPPPAVVLDVGGGPGAHARWLAGRGYEVHLIDMVPRHVEQARCVVPGAPALASAEVGDARALRRPDASCDVVLLLGPLYHLTAQADRLTALREARRVLRPGGWLFAAAISRFASLLDGLVQGTDDPRFSAIVTRDLADGQHRNPTEQIRFFTEAYFHHPEEMKAEVEEAGFAEVALFAIEGLGTIARDFEDRWADERRRAELLAWIRSVEKEPSLLGASPHVMAIARYGDCGRGPSIAS